MPLPSCPSPPMSGARFPVPPATAGKNGQGAAPPLPRRGDGFGRVEVWGRRVDLDHTHPRSPRRLPVGRCAVPAALPAQRAAELRRARQTRGFSGEAAAGSGSDRAAAPLALPRHRARREAGGGRHGEQAGAGPGRSLPAGGGRPPPGGCAPPRRRQRTASRRRPPPARPAATGGCHSSAPREPPRGNGRQAVAQGGVGGRRLRGAKVSRLLSRVSGWRSPPAAPRGWWKGTDPALTAGPTAPLSAPPPARGKVSLRNLAAAALSPWKRPPGFPPLPTGRGGGGQPSSQSR